MFGRRRGDFNAGRFWRWFVTEAQGLANTLEALSRGEADAEWTLIGLNERLHRYDPDMQADLVRSLEGGCRLALSGGDEHSRLALLNAAPRLPGWRFGLHDPVADMQRIPYRSLPRPSLDAVSADTLLQDAIAV